MSVIREDVIAAIASPVGPCARIVLRVSGEGAHAVVQRMACAQLPASGAVRHMVRVDELVFEATILLFEKGRSYTGEESAELHLPGNPLLARLTLEALYRAGARPAEPGEFTARAFFNGRLDLTEAEAVAATIAAGNQRELDAAKKLASGELTRQLRPITDDLAQGLALLEAGIDFSEEEIRFVSPEEMADRVQGMTQRLERLLEGSGRFERLSHEPVIVLCGLPNAGKSTLLNALAGRQRAVVSPIAGTTRDLLSAEIVLPRGVARMIDTAGLEAVDSAKDDSGISRQVQQHALAAIADADVLVLVRDAAETAVVAELAREPSLTIYSKCDVAAAPPGAMGVSAVTGEGMEALRQRLDELSFAAGGEEPLTLNARHVNQIRLAIDELAVVGNDHVQADELIAEHLRAAADALGEITGMVSTDDLLGRIFSTFCIGK